MRCVTLLRFGFVLPLLAGAVRAPLPAGEAPSFRLRFEGPSRLDAEPGETATIDEVVLLFTDGLADGESGARGWNLSIACDGCAIAGATTDGTAAADAGAGGLRRGGFAFTELTAGPGNEGVISVVILSFDQPVSLEPAESPHALLVVTVAAQAPDRSACKDARVVFRDGLQGSGFPMRNMVTYAGNSFFPDVTHQELRVCIDPCPKGGGPCNAQLPGDCDQDGTLRITDPVCILGALFLGTPPRLPCGDGLPGERSNTAVFDANGDLGVNLADAIYLLQYLFLGGPPHTQGTVCLPVAGCPEAESCP